MINDEKPDIATRRVTDLIIGYCRFSWFGISDTGRAISDIEAARSILWNPERMAVRFHLFENIMLPSIRSQTDQDFTLVVLVSNELPDVFHDTLQRMVAGMPNVEILATSETEIGAALKQKIQESVDQVGRSIHFRADDDDAMCSTYVERLRRVVDRHDFEEGTAISFQRGVTAFLHEKVAKHTVRVKGYDAQGLAFVVGKNYRRNPFQVQHRRVGRRQPSYVDPTFLAFHYTLHPVNNTNGYKTDLSQDAGTSRAAARILRNNPALVDTVAVPDVEKEINQAGFGSSAAELRKALEETLYPKRLAESYGFV